MSWTTDILLPDELDERLMRRRREKRMRMRNGIFALILFFLAAVTLLAVLYGLGVL